MGETKKVNDLTDANYIMKRQKLNISSENEKTGTEKIAGRWITYVVKQGDTLWDMTRAFGVLMEKLMSWNNLGTHSKLRVGDRIRIFLID